MDFKTCAAFELLLRASDADDDFDRHLDVGALTTGRGEPALDRRHPVRSRMWRSVLKGITRLPSATAAAISFIFGPNAPTRIFGRP